MFSRKKSSRKKTSTRENQPQSLQADKQHFPVVSERHAQLFDEWERRGATHFPSEPNALPVFTTESPLTPLGQTEGYGPDSSSATSPESSLRNTNLGVSSAEDGASPKRTAADVTTKHAFSSPRPHLTDDDFTDEEENDDNSEASDRPKLCSLPTDERFPREGTANQSNHNRLNASNLSKPSKMNQRHVVDTNENLLPPYKGSPTSSMNTENTIRTDVTATSKSPALQRPVKSSSATAVPATNSTPRLKAGTKPMRVLVVGGGPAGLVFATSLKELVGSSVSITVHEARVIKDASIPAPSLRWKTKSERVNRREQVVTLQSAVFSSLPERVKKAMFPPGSYSVVWPIGGESPQHLGFPRNIQILSIENQLLTLALQMGIKVEPIVQTPTSTDQQLRNKDFDFLVIADGPSSKIRKHYIDRFGHDQPEPFSLPDKPDSPVEDTVLALRVKCHMSDANTVILTICQNRFLLNAKNGEGYLYMRLTRHEAAEVRGRTSAGKYFTGCIQSEPCNMAIIERQDSSFSDDSNDNQGNHPQFQCSTHKTIFIPAVDSHSLLWPRVQEGLKLFNCDVKAVTVFRLSMTLRPRYTAEISELGTVPPVFAALIGDAANAIHFWPGRGLNHGIYSAVALARTILTGVSQFGRRQFLRSADLTQFEAAMTSLQHRHKDRAWRAMVQPTGDSKKLSAIADIIVDAIETSDASDRSDSLEVMEKRVNDLVHRLSSRLLVRPDAASIVERLRDCNVETLNVLVQSGPWETFLSGGPEVDIDALVPLFNAEQDSDLKPHPSSPLLQVEVQDDVKNRGLSGLMETLVGKDILSEESIKASFWHACQFSGSTGTLAWTEAAREIQALLIRANVGADVSLNDIFDAVEEADSDESDRIDVDEFVKAVTAVFHEKKKKVTQLGDIWTEQFHNAADAAGKVACRQAAGIVSRLAANLRPARPDLIDRAKLRSIFTDRCENEQLLIDEATFLEVAALVLFGP